MSCVTQNSYPSHANYQYSHRPIAELMLCWETVIVSRALKQDKHKDAKAGQRQHMQMCTQKRNKVFLKVQKDQI